MTVRKFIVEDDQRCAIDDRMSEIKRRLKQRGGSPLDPERVAQFLQAMIDGETSATELLGAEDPKRFDSILLVMHDQDQALVWRKLLEPFGYNISIATRASVVVQMMSERNFDLVILEDSLAEKPESFLLGWRGRDNPPYVIVYARYANVQDAVRCTHLGAFHYDFSPSSDLADVMKTIRRAESHRSQRYKF